MDKKRPVNLDLWTMKFPIIAIASILHRISGFIIFFLIPLSLWALQESLRSPAGFQAVSDCLKNPVLKLIIWGFLIALIYHLLAGIRHLFMDIGVGETLSNGRRAVVAVFILTVILIILAGWWLW